MPCRPGCCTGTRTVTRSSRRSAGTSKQKKPLTDNYTRFHRLGLALRPLLRDALDDKQQTLATFLPRGADAWRVAVELDRTYAVVADANRPPAGSWLSAGPAWRKN